MTAPLPANVSVISALPADHAGYSIADARAMEALSRAEDVHFWHRARNAFVLARLRALGVAPGARILELGCGGGAVAACLAGAGFDVTGVDGHLPRILEAARRAPEARFLVHDLARGLPREAGTSYEVAGLFDVVEHLEDPSAALHSALGAVREGGLIVGTVPALASLWSVVDEVSGHRLRYEKEALTALLEGIDGGEIAEILHFNRCLVPLLRIQRHRIDREPADALAKSVAVPPRPLNEALRLVLALERRLSRRLDRTTLPGASLWFALRRRARSR